MDKKFFSNLSRSAQEQYLIQEEILLGKYGPPGSPFLTTNALADTRNISVVTAHNILTGLRDAGFIELKGKKYYLSHSKLTENFLYNIVNCCKVLPVSAVVGRLIENG